MISNEESATVDWLSNSGEIGKLICAKDWSKTPLGAIASWPQSLRTALSLCLASQVPASVIWGPGHVQIYNDGYWSLCGDKHPGSMGQDYKECWLSAWETVAEAFESAAAGQPTLLEKQRMFLDRSGYLEETFFTFSFSPIRDETGGVGGLFHPVIELTQQTLLERRLNVLHDLMEGTAIARTPEDVCRLGAETLAAHRLDLPFALFYQLDISRHQARLISSMGLEPDSTASPMLLDWQASPDLWAIADMVRESLDEPDSAKRVRSIDDLERRFGSLPCDPYPESVRSAVVLPIALPGSGDLWGVAVVGVSPRRALDEAYQTFYTVLGQLVTLAIARTQTKPLTQISPPSILASCADRRVSTESCTVLLVNPRTEARNSLQQALCERWQVKTAETASAALHQIRQHLPDLIVTDVKTPEAGGLQLLATLRSDPKTRRIPIILLSASGEQAATIEGIEGGADDYVIEPFSTRELVARVATQLQVVRLRQEGAVNQLKTEFLLTITHELQAPLAAIVGWARLLQTQTFNPARVTQALTTIERNALIEAKLIRDLLDVSNILSGSLQLKSQLVNVIGLVKTAIATVREDAQSKRIELIETIVTTTQGDILADGDRLRQVIGNLLDNAIKFTPEGGRVEIQLETVTAVQEPEGNVSEQLSAPRRQIQITVIDTGIGISPDFLPHVFDRFSQAEVPSRHSPGGVGIGLAIARYLIELHQGSITAASDGEGRGATFTIKLPLDQSTRLSRDAQAQE